MVEISDFLKTVSYPGRGIIFGITPNGDSLVAAYFLMGRSENSRNRVFETDGKAIRTKAFDEAKLTDPSLVIYYPLRSCGNILILTNGDQTETIYQYIREGHSFEDALRTRTYEPDSLLTPRISGIMDLSDGSYRLSILKSNEDKKCNRFFYEYPGDLGLGHFISTYIGDNSNPLPFSSEPLTIGIEQNIDSFTNNIWHSLNEDNKVALFVKYISLETKEITTKIVNKYQ